MRTTITVLLLVAGVTAGCATPRTGILVMAHGGDEQWNEQVLASVEPLRSKYPIEIAFGMARTSTIRSAVHRLESDGVRRIAVVRMFVSGDSFVEPTEYILGLRDRPGTLVHSDCHAMSGPHEVTYTVPASHGANRGQNDTASNSHHMETPERIDTKCSFVLSRRGVGESPLVDDILIDRVQSLSANPANESVLILAHGPADEAENERWLANMRLRAQAIHDIGLFRHVCVETLREDWPDRRREAERRIRQYVESGGTDGGRVIVIPFRIAGFGPYAEILKGLEYVSDGRGFCPHPNITRWIETTATDCLSGHHGGD